MKFKSLSLLSFVFCTTLFAEKAPPPSSLKQGEPLPEQQYPAAYNAPSQVKLENRDGKWLPDLFIDASFIYYHADEEGLDLASSAAVVAGTGSFITAATSNSRTTFQEFNYKPGFKVGLGARFLEWTLAGEYTWIRQTNTTHRNAPNPNLADGIGVWVLNDWFVQLAPSGQAISATSLSSKWHLSMDLADLTLSRPFYQGRYLSVSPFFGLRAAWIRQTMNIGINIPTQVIASQTSSVTSSRTSSHSWALGPRAGLEADCLLGCGFRLQGDLAASLLFTQYTHVKHKENVAASGSIPSTLKASYSHYNCLRPIGELGLGLGWGSYLSGQDYHIDFSATYDFIVFWDQNMMRKLMDSTVEGVGGSAGNLNLHGLTLTARFDF